MTLLDQSRAWLLRNEKHPVRTPNGGYWRWTCLDPSASEVMSDLPRSIFDRLAPEAPNRPAWLFTTREKANAAAARAHHEDFAARWNATTPADEDEEWPDEESDSFP